DRPFGILGAHTPHRREFTIHDAHFLQAIANVLATAIDRARTEAALRSSEEHFRSLIENASDIVTVVGDNGVFRYASPSVERVLGYGPSELLERNAFDYVHPDDMALVTEALARAIQRPGSPQAAQFRFRARDGSWRLLDAVGQARAEHSGSAHLIVNARDVTERQRQERALRENKERLRTVIAGAPLVLLAGGVAVGTDITERLRAEEALRHSEESHRALVQHASYAIYRSTPDGRFLTVNPALVAMLGYESADQLLGVDLATDVYADPTERARILARFEKSGDAIDGVEVTWKRRNGQSILVRLAGRAVRRADGSIECFETIAEDVTVHRAQDAPERPSEDAGEFGPNNGN